MPLAAWLDAHHPRPKAEWVRLFKRTFRFTGGEIVGEFLMSTGYLPGAHAPECPAYERVARLGPPWMRAGAGRVAATTFGGCDRATPPVGPPLTRKNPRRC